MSGDTTPGTAACFADDEARGWELRRIYEDRPYTHVPLQEVIEPYARPHELSGRCTTTCILFVACCLRFGGGRHPEATVEAIRCALQKISVGSQQHEALLYGLCSWDQGADEPTRLSRDRNVELRNASLRTGMARASVLSEMAHALRIRWYDPVTCGVFLDDADPRLRCQNRGARGYALCEEHRWDPLPVSPPVSAVAAYEVETMTPALTFSELLPDGPLKQWILDLVHHVPVTEPFTIVVDPNRMLPTGCVQVFEDLRGRRTMAVAHVLGGTGLLAVLYTPETAALCLVPYLLDVVPPEHDHGALWTTIRAAVIRLQRPLRDSSLDGLSRLVQLTIAATRAALSDVEADPPLSRFGFDAPMRVPVYQVQTMQANQMFSETLVGGAEPFRRWIVHLVSQLNTDNADMIRMVGSRWSILVTARQDCVRTWEGRTVAVHAAAPGGVLAVVHQPPQGLWIVPYLIEIPPKSSERRSLWKATVDTVVHLRKLLRKVKAASTLHQPVIKALLGVPEPIDEFGSDVPLVRAA